MYPSGRPPGSSNIKSLQASPLILDYRNLNVVALYKSFRANFRSKIQPKKGKTQGYEFTISLKRYLHPVFYGQYSKVIFTLLNPRIWPRYRRPKSKCTTQQNVRFLSIHTLCSSSFPNQWETCLNLQGLSGSALNLRGYRRTKNSRRAFVPNSTQGSAAASAPDVNTVFTSAIPDQSTWKNPFKAWRDWWDLRSKVGGPFHFVVLAPLCRSFSQTVPLFFVCKQEKNT